MTVTLFYQKEDEAFILWFLEESGLIRKPQRSKKNQLKFVKKAHKCFYKNRISQ